MKLNIAIFGLSLTSSWGNGHATTYRALIKALAARGHRVTFLERDRPWYRKNCDLQNWPYCRIEIYDSLKSLSQRHRTLVQDADVVVLGSFVPDGAIVGDWITSTARGITAFYDIDTPVTLSRLERGGAEYIDAALIPRFGLYLSFTGGPILQLIEDLYGSPRARTLYCAVDPDTHAPLKREVKWSLGYMGTYSVDRQAVLERLLFAPARLLPDHKFVVVGAQYPKDINWPANVDHFEHLPPASHSEFYCSQRFTLNATRADMAAAGYSPSVRLFEAAACGVPVISDRWPGLEHFFTPGENILTADSSADVHRLISEMPDASRRALGAAARARVLQSHTAEHRAIEFERYVAEANAGAAAKLGIVAA